MSNNFFSSDNAGMCIDEMFIGCDWLTNEAQVKWFFFIAVDEYHE